MEAYVGPDSEIKPFVFLLLVRTQGIQGFMKQQMFGDFFADIHLKE